MSNLPNTKAPPSSPPGAAVSAAAATPKHAISERGQGSRRTSPRDGDESVRARVRVMQYAALMRGLPLTLGGMLVLATAIAALSPGVVDDALLMGWLVAMATLSLAGLQAWWRWRHADRVVRVPTHQLRLTTGLAGVAGALWGSVPALIYLRAGLAQQQFIAPLLIGLLGAGTFTLAALPPATAAYAGTLSLGMVTALALSSGAGHIPTLLGWLVFLAIGAGSALAHARELQARTTAEARNHDQQQLISLLLRDFEDSGSDALWEIDPRGCLVQPSKRLVDALGSSRKDLEGRPLRELLTQLQRGLPDQERESADHLAQRLTEGQPFRDVLLPLMMGAQVRWWSVTAKPLMDELGDTLGWRGVVRDVTQSRVADRKLSWLAHYDSLTGLINRAQFRVLVEHAISGKADDRDSARGTLLCLDLDNFKTVNDTLGHATGDALLAEVARRLKAAVSKIDVVARMGGDKFAVLVRHQNDENEIRSVAGRIVDSLRPPCEAQSAAVNLRTSIGVARFPQDGASVDELLQHADLALHDAKAESNGAIRFFVPSMGEQVRRRQVLERDLRLAIKGKQLSLHYQPKIDLASWRVTGFEALLRWNHPQHGAIPPSEFVRVAEDCGFIVALGEWALEEACRQAASWPQDLHVAVNISPVQVMAQNLPATVSRLLKASRLEPKRLELEITESVFLNEGSATAERLHALRKLGVRIALDDFGTGSSSLAYLRRFPFDTLKIDRAFIRELMVSREARAIVRNILALARSMRMATVAEGVEEPAQIKLLDNEGCSAVQGFYVAKPMPASEIEAFIIGWREDRKPVSRRARSSTGAAHASSAKAGQAAAASAATPAPAPTGDTAARSAPSRPKRSLQRSTEAV